MAKKQSGRLEVVEDQEEEVLQTVKRSFTSEEISRMNDRRKVLVDRITDQDTRKPFRNAYCFKAGYDFSSLKPYCESLIMVTDGWSDHIENSRAKLILGLEGYDSDKDVVVMAGRSIDHFIAGQIVTEMVLRKPKVHQSYAIAVYLNPNYIFYQIYLDASVPAHEIITK